MRRVQFVAALVSLDVDAVYAATGIDRATVKSCLFSVGFLLELAAVVQLRLWEDTGLTIHIDAGLPTADAACKELERRSKAGDADFAGIDLWRNVNRVWTRHCAWHGEEILGAEILLTEIDADVLVDALADFLWQNRHILGRQTGRHHDEATH